MSTIVHGLPPMMTTPLAARRWHNAFTMRKVPGNLDRTASERPT